MDNIDTNDDNMVSDTKNNDECKINDTKPDNDDNMELMSTKIIAVMEQEFRTGIKEMKSNKVADANETYDFIIPLDLEYYEKAKDKITMLIVEYENARRRFHKKNLDISDDLRRELKLINTSLEDLKRLTNLIPEFGGEADKYREKRQILAIGASLASFLLGNALNLDGDSNKLNELEEKYKLFSENNLEFEKEQIGVNNELSRQIIRINKNIKEIEDEGEKYKVLVDRKKQHKVTHVNPERQHTQGD